MNNKSEWPLRQEAISPNMFLLWSKRSDIYTVMSNHRLPLQTPLDRGIILDNVERIPPQL